MNYKNGFCNKILLHFGNYELKQVSHKVEFLFITGFFPHFPQIACSVFSDFSGFGGSGVSILDGPGIKIRAIIMPISGLKKNDNRNIPAKERFFLSAMLPAITEKTIHNTTKTRRKSIELSP